MNKSLKKWAVTVEEMWDEDPNPKAKPTPLILECYILLAPTRREAMRKAQEYFMKKYPEKVIGGANVDEITADLTEDNPSKREGLK